jgi:outer membrane protein assembly factor BamB
MRVLFACALVAACTSEVLPPHLALPVQAPRHVESVNGSLLDDQRRFEIAHGVVVDVAARRVVRDLVTEHDFVQADATDGEIAYVQVHRYDWVDDDIRAYRIMNGDLLWTASQSCWSIVATSAGLFCDDAMGHILLLRRATGHAHVVGRLGWNVSVLARAGGRVVAVGRDVARAAMFDATTGAHVAALDLPARMRVATTENGHVCGVAGALALCFDSSAQILWTRTLPTPIAIRMADARDMLVQAGTDSIALSLVDGREDASVHGEMASLVRAESGRLVGFVRAPPTTAFVDIDGRERWATDAFPYANAASALAFDGVVIIAAYNFASAGAWLQAFDHATGAPRWVASVQTLPIAHSAYSNDVELRLEHGVLVLRGRESMQDYLELFDPATGRRELSALAYR